MNPKTIIMKTIFSALIAMLFVFASCSSVKEVREPEYRDIRDIRLVEAGLLKSTAGMDLVYYNPNDFGVTLTDAHGSIYVDGQYLGRFHLDEKVSVKKRSEFVVPALVDIDMIGAVKNHRDIFQKKEARIKIDGTARVSKAGFGREVPISYESVQNIERFRALVRL
jgi:LEA14-like dessication related protein